MGCKVSTPAETRQEPPAPFALPCLPNEFIEGDALFLTDDYVPYPLILQHKCIVARIVNVTDGDTFRGRGQNAQYNGKLARLEQLLQEASDKKVGMFAPEGPPLESPASFKRRMKEELLELPSAIDPDYVAADEELHTQTTRGRSPDREDRRNRRGSASSSARTNARRASEPRKEGNGKAGPEVAQQGRAKKAQRRKKKSRSRSARRRRAAERAAARAASPGEQNLQDQTGDAPSMSAQSRSLVQAAEPNQHTRAGGRKGLHVRGISEGDGDPVNIDTLTYSIEEAPAATGSRRGSVYTDQAAAASVSLSSSGSLGTGKPTSNAPDAPIILEMDAQPLIEVDHEESIASGELSENEYEGREVDGVDESESESE
ncbi:hypothetical protein Emag_003317 [Eimeria magna]